MFVNSHSNSTTAVSLGFRVLAGGKPLVMLISSSTTIAKHNVN
ncbi:MAG: hypothetical protein AAFO95_03090 [Cyanobacteria bacterium J06600_6]